MGPRTRARNLNAVWHQLALERAPSSTSPDASAPCRRQGPADGNPALLPALGFACSSLLPLESQQGYSRVIQHVALCRTSGEPPTRVLHVVRPGSPLPWPPTGLRFPAGLQLREESGPARA
jgi:hypothetical protein